ncbi:uracil-DNA glycosylase family protein [Candidatus Roseilinea sp. NK_OTU-006]
MLVGQALAAASRSHGNPFSGQAGRVLFRWLAQAGFSEEAFRCPTPAASAVGRTTRATANDWLRRSRYCSNTANCAPWHESSRAAALQSPSCKSPSSTSRFRQSTPMPSSSTCSRA